MATIASLVPDVRQMFSVAIPDVQIENAYRWVAREFMRKSRWLRETITVNILQDVNSYALTSTETDTEVFNIQAAQQEGEYLTPATQEEVRSETEGWYFFVPPRSIQLSATPSADSAGGLLVRAILNLTSSATTIPDSVLGQWNADISYGAISRLAGMKASPWADAGIHDMYRKMYVDGLLQARHEAEKQAKAYAYGSVQG